MEMCTENAGRMLRDRVLADTLAEAATGGEGHLLLESAGEEAFVALYRAVAAAAATEPEDEEDEDEDEEEEEEEGEGKGEGKEEKVGDAGYLVQREPNPYHHQPPVSSMLGRLSGVYRWWLESTIYTKEVLYGYFTLRVLLYQ
eukprot:5854472-Pyramimonas_sp.AAC.1